MARKGYRRRSGLRRCRVCGKLWFRDELAARLAVASIAVRFVPWARYPERPVEVYPAHGGWHMTSQPQHSP